MAQDIVFFPECSMCTKEGVYSVMVSKAVLQTPSISNCLLVLFVQVYYVIYDF